MKRVTQSLSGLQIFLIIWFGELISATGTQMVRFALIIWAYERTGEATTLALVGFASFVFYVLLSPIAGVWVDRLDRRVVMLLADGGAGISTAIILLLYVNGTLDIWHVILYEAVTGAFDAFYLPAYNAAMTTLIDKSKRGRMNGLRSFAFSITRVFAPVLGTIVLSIGGLAAVMAVDLITFLAAYISLLLVRIPKPQVSDVPHGEGGKGGEVRPSWRLELAEAFRYLKARKGLLYLIALFTAFNAVASFTYFGVFSALILARTGGDEGVLAAVRAAMGIAAVIGGIAATWWVGRIKLIHGVLACTAISFLAGDFLMGISRDVTGWIVAGVVTEFFIPILVTSKRTILQNKVTASMQGRVFALDGMLTEAAIPLGYLLAGVMADRVFEPAMQPDGALAGVFGGLVGTGAGAGMGVMYLGTAIMGAAIALFGYLIPSLRRVETDVPDAESDTESTQPKIEPPQLDAAPSISAISSSVSP